MLNLQPEMLNRMQSLIHSTAALNFTSSRIGGLARLIMKRMGERDFASSEQYLHLLETNPTELRDLIEEATTKETSFFRLPGQFEMLGREIVPALEKQLTTVGQGPVSTATSAAFRRFPLRIWSAGCSTGEEPYSIAMTVIDGLKFPRAWALEILATDLSSRALARAQEGIYPNPVGIAPAYQGKFLRSVPEGIAIHPEIRDKVRFRRSNLNQVIQGAWAGVRLDGLDGRSERADLRECFHLIFCRNVMIYFDFASQQRLIEGLYQCLKPGGWLFLGEAECLYPYQHRFQTISRPGAVVHRKPEPEAKGNRRDEPLQS